MLPIFVFPKPTRLSILWHIAPKELAFTLYFYTFLPLTLPRQGAKVLVNICRKHCGGKELIMTVKNPTNLTKSVMGFCYFYFFKACFFAGLFCYTLKPNLSGL